MIRNNCRGCESDNLKRILDLGFTISGNIEKEINQLLINTKQWFSSEFK